MFTHPSGWTGPQPTFNLIAGAPVGDGLIDDLCVGTSCTVTRGEPLATGQSGQELQPDAELQQSAAGPGG